jgi:hypothetical protein
MYDAQCIYGEIMYPGTTTRTKVSKQTGQYFCPTLIKLAFSRPNNI